MQSGLHSYQTAPTWKYWDLFVVTGLALGAGLLALWCQDTLGSEIYAKRFFDLWFSADQPRVLGNLVDPAYWDHRSYIHPLFKLAFYPLTKLLISTGLDSIRAAQTLVAASVSLAVPLFYAGLRGMRLPIAAALLFSACLFAGAALLHWAALTETYPFAFFSLSAMFAILTCTRSKVLFLLGSLFTLTVTITNWSFGIAAAFFKLRFRSFLVVVGLTFFIAIALGYFQHAAFKDAKLLMFFNPANLSLESQWTQPALEKSGMLQWDPIANMRSLLIYSAVAPPPEQINRSDSWHQYRAVDNQSVPLTRFGPLSAAAAVAWSVMVIVGVWGGIGYQPGRREFLALTTFVLGQMALHLIYGDVVFLYSLHVFPVLLAIAAFGWFSPARLVSIGAALVFLIAAGLSNYHQFRAATEMAKAIISDSPAAESFVIVSAGGDAYRGVPKFRLLADGRVVGYGEAKLAVNSLSGEWFDQLGLAMSPYLERFVFLVEDIEAVATLEVEFVNDDWAGEGQVGDRNLFVTSVSVNTVEFHSGVRLVTTADFDAGSLKPVMVYGEGARVTTEWAGLYGPGKLRLERPTSGWTAKELGVPVRPRSASANGLRKAMNR
jgi:hypothetical protein